MYFLSSLRAQTAKTLICTKSGVSADARKSVKKCGKVRKTTLFAKRGLFRKVHFQEILENLEILEILENPQTVENGRRIRSFSRDFRESRDFRDSRASSSEKTPFVMTPFSGPEVNANRGRVNHKVHIVN